MTAYVNINFDYLIIVIIIKLLLINMNDQNDDYFVKQFSLKKNEREISYDHLDLMNQIILEMNYYQLSNKCFIDNFNSKYFQDHFYSFLYL